MIVGVLTTCHKQYTWDSSICVFFYLIEQHLKVLLTNVQVLYMNSLCDSTAIQNITADILQTNSIIVLMFVESQRVHI